MGTQGQSREVSIPFRRIPLFLNLGEHTIRLVVGTMRAFGHLPVTFDLLLPTHVAGLPQRQ